VDNIRRDRRNDIDRHRRDIRDRRSHWSRNHGGNFRRTIPSYRNDRNYWAPRFDRWWYYNTRPVYVVIPGFVWLRPMPPVSYWDYYQVELIAHNLEDISHRVYATMSHPSVPYANPSYRPRLMASLGELIGAAMNYVEAVEESYDWSGSLHDLFYLDERLSHAENTLSGFSQAYRVQNEMRLFRYYVNELLWQYRYYY
jgi:hypothetical protein